MRHPFAASLIVTAALLGGCGKAGKLVAPEPALKPVPTRAAIASADREKAFPASVATLAVASAGKAFLVVRFRAQKLGFNQVSKVGFPVLVRNQQQFKTNLYLGTDDQLYISDLGSAKVPRFWRVGAWGTSAVLAGKPREGATVNLRFDPGILFDIGLAEDADKPAIVAAMAIKSTPPATTEPPLWSEPLDGAAAP